MNENNEEQNRGRLATAISVALVLLLVTVVWASILGTRDWSGIDCSSVDSAVGQFNDAVQMVNKFAGIDSQYGAPDHIGFKQVQSLHTWGMSENEKAEMMENALTESQIDGLARAIRISGIDLGQYAGYQNLGQLWQVMSQQDKYTVVSVFCGLVDR